MIKSRKNVFACALNYHQNFYNCVTFYNTPAADHNFSHPASFCLPFCPRTAFILSLSNEAKLKFSSDNVPLPSPSCSRLLAIDFYVRCFIVFYEEITLIYVRCDTGRSRRDGRQSECTAAGGNGLRSVYDHSATI